MMITRKALVAAWCVASAAIVAPVVASAAVGVDIDIAPPAPRVEVVRMLGEILLQERESLGFAALSGQGLYRPRFATLVQADNEVVAAPASEVNATSREEDATTRRGCN